ncbi:MAG: ESX secretion-associated protein EspG [Nocardiaceae bacterium]|nr:ESX secretion-associated protein EspG [Nocardiaceae bacterium]
MTAQWRVSGFDFVIACELAGRDTLPYPIEFVHRPMGAAEYRLLRNAAAERIHAMDPDFFTALRVLARPDLRISVDGAGIRSYVADAGGFTAVATENGDVTVRLTSARAIDEAVRALPVGAAGHRRRIEGPNDDVQLLLDSAAAAGALSVAAGVRGNWLGSVKWADLRDGRYVVTESEGWTTLTPATAETVSHQLSLLVRAAMIEAHG